MCVLRGDGGNHVENVHNILFILDKYPLCNIGCVAVMQKTTITAKEPKTRSWVMIDLAGKPLGRVASQIADILRGRHRANFTPNVDTGDFVVAINASKVKLTGDNKSKDKMYYWHSRYIGGLREMNAEKLMARHPEELIMRAVKGMLPHNELSRKVLKKLRIYSGSEHPYKKQLAS